jgi:hypothetical protein
MIATLCRRRISDFGYADIKSFERSEQKPVCGCFALFSNCECDTDALPKPAIGQMSCFDTRTGLVGG